MCSNTSTTITNENLCEQTLNPLLSPSASLKKSLPFSKRLLTVIKLTIVRFLEHFWHKQSTTPKSAPLLLNSCHHEQSATELTYQENKGIQRDRSILHLRLRPTERDKMPDRVEKDAVQEPKRNNYHDEIVALKDHFLSIIPPDHIFYQLTIHCRRDTLDNTAWKADRVKNVIEKVYQQINQAFVHQKHYAHEPHKEFMPYLLGMLEFDDNVLWHCHCLVAVHPHLADKFDELCIYDKFKRFDPRITQSHFDRTIPDARDIKAFDEPTNVSKWINYMLKRNKHFSLMPKKREHLLMFAPKQ